MKTIDAQGALAFNDVAEAAIAQVLGAEREARDSIASARLEVDRVAENARIAARSMAERTERRVRAAVVAFEVDLAARLADIEVQAVGLESAQPLSAEDAAALQATVRAVAQEWVGAAR